MPWDDEFFDRRRLTSKLKHYVLRRYVKEFAYHLGTVYYVDGFAGVASTERARIERPDRRS